MLDAAIIGAGPYGLSIAAHLRRSGVSFRIFGRPMDSWLNHMPSGMVLKSDGFASNIYDPDGEFTLKHFCADRGIDYSDTEIPVRLETFSAYGLSFRNRVLPELEDKLLVSLERAPEGFLLQLDSDESIRAKRVVLAVGITHFEHIPENLAHLPTEFLSHSFHQANPDVFRGRSVVVIGGGASAIDLAALLHEAGAEVQLVARKPSLRFHNMPTGKSRSWWEQLRHPKSGLGPGLRSRFFSDAPMLFHYFPKTLRVEAVRRTLGPSAGWSVKEKMAQVRCLLGYAPESAEIHNDGVCLHLRTIDGSGHEVFAQHVIAATGYKVDLQRLPFLSADIRSKIKLVKGAPALSSSFESSVRGLYFTGLTAANSFGPLMRFAFGAGFAARRINRAMVQALAENPTSLPVRNVETVAK